MVMIGIRVTSIFLGNNFYFYFIVRPRIYSFLRKALDYRYPGKNPKYKELIELKEQPNKNGLNFVSFETMGLDSNELAKLNELYRDIKKIK